MDQQTLSINPEELIDFGGPYLIQPREQHYFPTIFIIIIIILIIVIAILIYALVRQGTTLISTDKCPDIKANYAALPGVTKTILTQCGSNLNENCIIDQETLEAAVQYCNNQVNICNEFSYDPTNKVMTIVEPNSSLQVSQNENLYLRQIPKQVSS